MLTRRQSLKTFAALSATSFMPSLGCSSSTRNKTNFRFCLNTSTIREHKLTLPERIEITAKAGYDGIELWLREIRAHLEEGHSLTSLNKHIKDTGLKVECAIAFAEWITDDEERRAKGFALAKEEMEILSELGCTRIAAPPSGARTAALDLFQAAERYKQLLALGRQTGVRPHLEFWGSSPSLFHIGQAMMVAAIANDPDACILVDVYQLFRGDSGFNSMKMLSGETIEVVHMNDYPGNVPREKQTDSDRVYPGDGVAPMKQFMTDLKNMGGTKILSLEVFNKEYWKQDALAVAKTGLQKMKAAVEMV